MYLPTYELARERHAELLRNAERRRLLDELTQHRSSAWRRRLERAGSRLAMVTGSSLIVAGTHLQAMAALQPVSGEGAEQCTQC